MKKTDIAMIILIASVSVLVAYFAGKAILGDPKEKSTKVRTSESITSEVPAVNPAIFNKDAINPTVEVYIGDANATSQAKENQDAAASAAANANGANQ